MNAPYLNGEKSLLVTKSIFSTKTRIFIVSIYLEVVAEIAHYTLDQYFDFITDRAFEDFIDTIENRALFMIYIMNVF
jgi:hypothetical protein